MRRTASALGPVEIDLPEFLLGKWPVKNSEYELFVARSRDPENGMRAVRPPFLWWKLGAKKDYEERLPEINQRFPGNENGPLEYWKQEGAKLPYQLIDEKGNSTADHPVGGVTYIDANEFAASIGMRLPLEAEWTRAARGNSSNLWPWGNPQGGKDVKDVFVGNANMEVMRLFAQQDRHPKPVGTVEAASGPFGHLDMFGSIWQLVTGSGNQPINGADEFAAQWRLLQRDKAGALLKAPPRWDQRVVAKGGSFMSAEDPIQLLIDQRAPMYPDDVLEALGFRLAKSLRPGYDTLFSRLRGVYNRARFLPEQDIDLTGQVGAERYDLAENGFPTEYHTVSFAPANWLSLEKRTDLKKLSEASHRSPLVLGTLVTTEKIVGCDVKGTAFTLLWRADGMPQELTEAIKRGYKEVQARLKAEERAAKSGKPKKEEEEEKSSDDKKDDKKKKDNWGDVLRRYGLTAKDLEPKDADKLDYIRIDETVVKTDRAAFLLHDNNGKIVASIPATNVAPKAGRQFATELEFTAGDDGKAVARFHIGVPMSMSSDKKVLDLQFHLPLDCPAPTDEKPWRLPE
ncbi:MAG: SUMF1/EgtB/PvdO family nonheme iron enzyme [Planctomycetes bacterium]|nr:SUMF1/EgtB/PvdO family nonheme iron enzyme [Planctomycetota bacterium]